MAKVKILAGDLPAVRADFNGMLGAALLTYYEGFRSTTVDLKTDLERVEAQTEDSVKKLGAATGWGIVGAVAFGPVGALAGALLGGRGKEVCFAAYLKDGRKFLAVTDSKTFQKISALTF